jgi:hypothetical protein
VHVDLQRIDGGPRRLVTPERIDDPVPRDDLAGFEQQRREQRTLLRRADR